MRQWVDARELVRLLESEAVGALCVSYFVGILAALAGVVAYEQISGSQTTLLLHGKQLRTKEERGETLGLRVPKTRFWQFYAVGTASSLALVALVVRAGGEARPMAAIAAFLLHSLRRLYEQVVLFGTRHGRSQMHAGHYLLGLTFYAVTPVAVARHASQAGPVQAAVAAAIFASATGMQAWHHAALAQATRARVVAAEASGAEDIATRPPENGLFAGAVACPHYFCEVVLYAALVAMGGGPRDVRAEMWLLVLWVATNLAVSAHKAHAHYVRRDCQAQVSGTRQAPRYRMVPFVY